MAIIVGFIVIGLVKNAAGTVGLMLGGESLLTGVGGVLEGGGSAQASKGSFNLGGGKTMQLG